jgi:hypothetical protein
MNYSPIIIVFCPPTSRDSGGYLWTIKHRYGDVMHQMKAPFESLIECLKDASDELSDLLEVSPEVFKDRPTI